MDKYFISDNGILILHEVSDSTESIPVMVIDTRTKEKKSNNTKVEAM